MSQLDPRTLIFVSGLLGLLCSVILFVQRRSFPATIKGLGHWSLGSLAAVVSSFLFGMRGIIPDLFTVVVANGLLVGGFMLIYAGLLRFSGRRPNYRVLVAILGLVIALSAWFTFVDFSYPARVLLLTSTDALILSTCARLTFKEHRSTLAGRFTGAVFALTALVSTARFVGMLIETTPSTGLLDASLLHKVYLASFAFFVLTMTVGLMMMANERLRAALEYIAAHDSLSGAYSRGTLLNLMAKKLARSQRHQRPLAALMFDLDNFKLINDRFGHLAGDHVIVQFVHQTETLLRKHDYLGRYGGEEFIALLPETSHEDATVVAERICETIAATSAFDVPSYTVSIGVATTADGNMSVDELLGMADKALYAAKQHGRNRVEHAEQQKQDAQRVG